MKRRKLLLMPPILIGVYIGLYIVLTLLFGWLTFVEGSVIMLGLIPTLLLMLVCILLIYYFKYWLPHVIVDEQGIHQYQKKTLQKSLKWGDIQYCASFTSKVMSAAIYPDAAYTLWSFVYCSKEYFTEEQLKRTKMKALYSQKNLIVFNLNKKNYAEFMKYYPGTVKNIENYKRLTDIWD